MPLGPLIRRSFGPFEHAIAENYRRIFIDLDELGNLIRKWVPSAHRILEVGCGEGAMTERLVRNYPNAAITAIDISEKVGRLFGGPKSNVTFMHDTIENVSRAHPSAFDLAVLSDVLHHVPQAMRIRLLQDISEAMGSGGSFVCKEWLRSPNLIHLLAHAADRYLTGDDVTFLTRESLLNLLGQVFPGDSIRQIGFVRPWHNNFAVLVQR